MIMKETDYDKKTYLYDKYKTISDINDKKRNGACSILSMCLEESEESWFL